MSVASLRIFFFRIKIQIVTSFAKINAYENVNINSKSKINGTQLLVCKVEQNPKLTAHFLYYNYNSIFYIPTLSKRSTVKNFMSF